MAYHTMSCIPFRSVEAQQHASDLGLHPPAAAIGQQHRSAGAGVPKAFSPIAEPAQPRLVITLFVQMRSDLSYIRGGGINFGTPCSKSLQHSVTKDFRRFLLGSLPSSKVFGYMGLLLKHHIPLRRSSVALSSFLQD